ncbi:hypothetical protein HKI87_05g35760 [Chloropicon roscoffensis]|uniref:F-box domain-containing protein n=1 Tax=Chloropicon roscoffensis TaxID=1461544 RepID=A0AAX4P7P2_9CHLO
MAGAAGEPSAKRAKVDEAEEEEDPLVRRKEEVVRLLEEASAKGKDNARAKEELLTLCSKLEVKNEKLLRRLPPELWQKIVDENVHQNDLLALAMTCRFFREKQKDLGKKVETNLYTDRLLSKRLSGKIPSYTLGWFRWVCDTMEILPGYEWSYYGPVYEGNLVNYAAFQGSVEILRWLVEEKGWELNLLTGLRAGRGGSVEVLEYLLGKGYVFDERACSGAAKEGHLKALKFLRGLDPPCPWDVLTCSCATYGGHLDVLKWARSEDPPCPWDEVTCAGAADEGRLDILKFARGQDPPCPWDKRACSFAVGKGRLDVLKFLRSQDPPCPWDGGSCATAAWKGYLEVLKWLRDQDPPCPWARDICSDIARAYRQQHIVDWIDQQEDESDCEEKFRDWDSMAFSYSDNDL